MCTPLVIALWTQAAGRLTHPASRWGQFFVHRKNFVPLRPSGSSRMVEASQLETEVAARRIAIFPAGSPWRQGRKKQSRVPLLTSELCTDIWLHVRGLKVMYVLICTSMAICAYEVSSHLYVNMYEHVGVEHLSQAQHSAVSPPAQSSKASGQGCESQHVVEHLHYTARGVRPTNEGIEICPAYKNKQPLTKQLIHSWCDARRMCLCFQSQQDTTTALSLRPSYCMHFVYACGARVVFLEHGALGICNSSVCS